MLLLFQWPLNECKFPKVWKNSYIIRMCRTVGERNITDNYRGVCNQSVIAKIFDFIASKQLQRMSSCIISEKQHGFVEIDHLCRTE